MNGRTEGRLRQLDGLRGIAALAVVLYHYFWLYDYELHGFAGPRVFRFGSYGVELFFVISGFVIYYTLHKSSVAEFLVNRFIRLFPTYWLCLAVTFTVVALFPLDEIRNTHALDALENLTMLNGVIHVKYVDPSYWSLQVELFFYFGMAVVLMLKRLERIQGILWGWLALVVVYHLHKLPGLGMLLNLSYGPLFIAGICFYRLKFGARRALGDYALLAASYTCALFALQGEQSVLALTVIYAVFALGVFGSSKLLSSKLVTFLGAISYSLYLLHQNIGFVILHELARRGLSSAWFALVPIAVSVALASLVTFWFERPVLRWLKQSYRRTLARAVPEA